MRKKLTIGVLAVAVTFGLMTTVSAQDSDQDSDVEVNVSETVQLDARPSTLQYGQDGGQGIEPGALKETSDGGYEHIDIENIGSVPIDQVHAQATMPEESPFGIDGDSENSDNSFDTGNFLIMSTDTADTEYSSLSGVNGISQNHYLNRVEYHEDNPPEYIFTEDGDIVGTSDNTLVSSASTTDVGRFRVGEAEYFYALYTGNADGTTDDADEWVMRIGETPHTPDQLGTVDFRNPDNVDGEVDYHEIEANSTNDVSGADIAQFQSKTFVGFDTSSSGDFDGQSLLDGSGVNSTAEGDVSGTVQRNYNLYIDGENDQVMRSSFNIEQQSPDYDGEGTGYITGEENTGDQQAIFSSNNDPLEPGMNFPIDVGIQLPNGVDRDRVDTGTITLIATETIN